MEFITKKWQILSSLIILSNVCIQQVVYGYLLSATYLKKKMICQMLMYKAV
jgi:hypothetical protein